MKLILECYYMSNDLTFEYSHILPMLGYDLKISCAKFQENRFIIEGEIDKKHALHTCIYQIIVAQGIEP